MDTCNFNLRVQPNDSPWRYICYGGNMRLTFLFLFVFQLTAFGQVGDIKSASAKNASGGGGGDRRGGGGAAAYFLVDFFVNNVGVWQQQVLQKREINPYLVSLDVIGQVAIQPSRYYLSNPRIRGNWGLFSTDFRFNYLLQENITGTEDLGTFDWQILQLNIITTRHVIGRVGGGLMQENFGGRGSFFESTYGIFAQSTNKKIGGTLEYRVAQDFTTGIVPRRELSASFERRIFSRGNWNGYLTIGGVYQRYYESINVWGIQAGIAFRIFSPPLQSEP